MQFTVKLLVLTSLLFFSLIISGCTTTVISRGPEWLQETPQGDKGEIFVISGPSATLAEAKALSYKEISQVVSTTVTAVTSNYISITSSELETAVEEQFTRSIETGTETVLVGINFPERWQDPKTQLWWVLAVVAEEDLQQGIEKTAEMLFEKQKLMETYAADITTLLSPLFETDSILSIRKSLSILSQAQQALDGSGFIDELYADLGGARVLVQSYLNSSLSEMLGCIQVDLRLPDTTLYKAEENPLEIHISTQTGITLGELNWLLYADGKPVAESLTRNSTGAMIIPVDQMITGSHIVSLKLDTDSMGLVIPGALLERIPQDVVEVVVSAGKLGYQFSSESEIDTTHIANELNRIYSENLPYTFTKPGDSPYSLILEAVVSPGTENDYGLMVIHLYVTSTLKRNGKELFFSKTPSVKGIGLDADQALRKAVTEIIELIDQTPEEFTQVIEAFES